MLVSVTNYRLKVDSWLASRAVLHSSREYCAHFSGEGQWRSGMTVRSITLPMQ